MLNGVQIIGVAHNIETGEYPDGAVITHFDLDYARATRTETFHCRMIHRKGTNPLPLQIPEEGSVVAIAGQLVNFGNTRTGIDVRQITRPEAWGGR